MNFYLFILLAWIFFFINFRRRLDKRHLVVFPWQVMFRCILSPSQKRVLGKRKKIHKYLNLFLVFFIISSTIINAKQIKSTVSLFKPTMKQIRLKTITKKGACLEPPTISSVAGSLWPPRSSPTPRHWGQTQQEQSHWMSPSDIASININTEPVISIFSDTCTSYRAADKLFIYF